MPLKTSLITRILVFAMLFGSMANAAPLTFNLDGVITDASNQPLEAASVTFRVDIKDSAETCLLYREDFSISMTGSNGYFSIVIGKQTNAVSGGVGIDKVFSNAAVAIPGQSCSYTPSSANETRKIIVSFNDGNSSQIFSAQEIQSVPYALEADQASNFTGSLSGDVTGNQSTTVVSKIQGHNLDLTGVADGKILKYQGGGFVVSDDLTGTSGLTSLNGLNATSQSFGAIDLGNSVLSPTWVSATNVHTLKIPMASATGVTAGLLSNVDYKTMMEKQSNALTSGQLWVGNSVNGAQARALGGDIASISDTGVVTLKSVGTAGTYYKVITDAQGRVTGSAVLNATDITTALAYTPVNKAGDTMSGDLNFATGKFLGINSNGGAGSTEGQIWYNAGKVYFRDGTGAKELGVAGAGITSFNGSTVGTQTLETPTTAGTTFDWNTNTGTGAHTLNIPMASTATVTAGLLSNADHVSFTGKLTSPLTTKGDLLTRDGATHVRLPVGNNNEVLMVDSAQASGLKWAAMPAAGITALTGDITATGPGSVAATIGASKVTSSHILDGEIVGADMNFTGLNIATSSIVIKDNSGKFFNFNCSTAGHVATWTATGWDCQAPAAPAVNNAASLASNKIWIGNASGVAEERALSGDATISNVGLLTLKNTGTAGTYTKVITDAQGRVTGNGSLNATDITTALTFTPVNKAGDTMNGDLSFAAGKFLGINSNGGAGSTEGQIWYNAGKVYFRDGTGAKELGVAGAGITSFNGSTVSTQTFTVPGTSGNTPNWSTNTGSGTHTLNIPMANTGASVTAGLVSNADYSVMMAKQSTTLPVAQVWVGNGSNIAEPRTLSGDIASVSPTGAVSILKSTSGAANQIVALDGTGVGTMSGLQLPSGPNSVTLTAATTSAGSYVLRLPAGAPANNQILRANSSGDLSWVSNVPSVNNATSLTSGKVWIGNTSNVAVESDISGDATLSPAGVLTLKNTGVAGTYTKVVTDVQGRVVLGYALTNTDVVNSLGYAPVNSAGDTMSGALNFAGNDITSVGTLYSVGALNLTAAGGAAGASNVAGANVNITAQTATGTGNGGNIFLNPGATASGLRGAVSIGNPTPNQTYLLNVGSSSSPDVAMFQGNSASSSTGYFLNHSAGGSAGMFVNANSGAYAKLGTGNSSAIFGTTGSSPGNVGIGISNPTSKLHVNDTYSADPGSAVVAATITQSSSSTASSLTGLQSSVTNTGPATITDAYGAQFNVTNTGGGTITNGYGIYIGNTSATNKYAIYSSDAASKNYFAGRIGLGTINPTAMMEISSNIIPTLKVTNTQPYATAIFSNSDGTELSITAGANAVRMVGHMRSEGFTPVLGACIGTLSPTSTDTRGAVTFTSPSTTCTIIFNKPYSSAPYCVVSHGAGLPTTYVGASTTTTDLTITLSTSASGKSFNYICME